MRHPNLFTTIENLVTVTGGQAASSQTNQAELRQMARQYCPQTYRRYQNAPQITRPMAERCLDEAGYGWARGRLDRYFPRTR